MCSTSDFDLNIINDSSLISMWPLKSNVLTLVKNNMVTVADSVDSKVSSESFHPYRNFKDLSQP